MSLAATTGRLALVEMSEIEEYPLTRDDRLNSHFFMFGSAGAGSELGHAV